jgi:hypothetical protein
MAELAPCNSLMLRMKGEHLGNMWPAIALRLLRITGVKEIKVIAKLVLSVDR